MNNIASVYDNLGRYDEALENVKKSLAIKQKIFGTDENASIAGTLSKIGLICHKFCKYDEALVNYEKCLTICQNIFGYMKTHISLKR